MFPFVPVVAVVAVRGRCAVQRCKNPTHDNLLLCPTPAPAREGATQQPPPTGLTRLTRAGAAAAPCTSMTPPLRSVRASGPPPHLLPQTPQRGRQSGTSINLGQGRCGVMALAGSHCLSSSAAGWLPLCTVNVHSPLQVPVVSLTQACSRPGQ